MKGFKKGDILVGEKDEFEEAYHPIVFIRGDEETPLAVILTHGDPNKYPCNIQLSNIYDPKDPRTQYFVAHLIQKMSEWGPYEKTDELSPDDLALIEKHISDMSSITWSEHEAYTKNGCPEHGKH